MERVIDHKLLASFIEYAAKGVVTPFEWDRFIITHYPDEKMEHARAECVRVFLRNKLPLPQQEKDYLFELAQKLREPEIL